MMAHVMRVPFHDPFCCPFRGCGAAALARAHFGKEAWDTVICDTKRMFAALPFLAFEATVHQILRVICAQISLDLRVQNDKNLYVGACFLWLPLWNGFVVAPDRSGSLPDAIWALPWEALGSLEALLGAPGSALKPSREALGGTFFGRTPGPFSLLASLGGPVGSERRPGPILACFF